MKQRTLAAEVIFEGAGVHSGAPVKVICRPAPSSWGLRFRRSGAAENEALKADLDFTAPDDSLRRTVLRSPAGWAIETPEHLLACCAAFGLTNLEIEQSAAETPILDGSAAPFAEGFLRAGIAEQEGPPAPEWTVNGPVAFRAGEAEIAALPARDALLIACFVEYPGSAIGSQAALWRWEGGEAFAREIAPARTFALKRDIEALRAMGLIRGGSLECALVADEKDYVNPPPRFENECARHKIIDLLGDLTLAGGLPRGHFMVFRAGHAAHLAFGRHLRKENRVEWLNPPAN